MSDYRRHVSAACGMLAFLALMPASECGPPDDCAVRRAPPQLQRRLAILQRGSRGRGETGVRRLRVALRPAAPRLGDRRPVRSEGQPADRRAAHLRHRLVSQVVRPSGRRQRKVLQHRVRWRHGQLESVVERARPGRASLWLYRFQPGPHAVPEFRWRGQRALRCG